MLEWIVNNIATIIICAALAIMVTLIILKLAKDKKAGKSSCGCSCSSCPMSVSCHSGSSKCHPDTVHNKGAR